MKYYSERLDRIYNSVEELKTAEAEDVALRKEIQEREEKARKEAEEARKKAEIEKNQLENEVREAKKELDNALEKYHVLLNKYEKKFPTADKIFSDIIRELFR